uniref:tetratricopeptide repeat protein n=1 Tax=Paraburkholderia tropica TaxID=92647 RepID=UPI002AB693A8
MSMLLTSTDIITPPADAQQELNIDRMVESAIECHRKQQYLEAATLYMSVLGVDSDNLDANYNLGVLRLQTEQPAEAVRHFEVVLGQTPKNGQIWIYYINALVASDQSEAARAALEIARQHGLPEGAVATLRARINGKESLTTYTARSETTPQTDPQPEIAPESEGLLKLDTRRASAKERRQYQQLVKTGRFDAAQKVARRLVKQYPSHGECWAEFSHILQTTGQYTEAVEAAGRAARLLPNDIAAQTACSDLLVI